MKRYEDLNLQEALKHNTLVAKLQSHRNGLDQLDAGMYFNGDRDMIIKEKKRVHRLIGKWEKELANLMA